MRVAAIAEKTQVKEATVRKFIRVHAIPRKRKHGDTAYMIDLPAYVAALRASGLDMDADLLEDRPKGEDKTSS